jgi:hypothetical protein
MNIAFVGTSGMGLPDRDYYLLDKYKPQRDAYRAYIQRTLTDGDTNASAAADTQPKRRCSCPGSGGPAYIDKLNNPTPAQRAWRQARLGQTTTRVVSPADRRRQYGGEGAGAVRQIAARDAEAVAAVRSPTSLSYLSKRRHASQSSPDATGAKAAPRWRRGIAQSTRLVVSETYARYFPIKAMMEEPT